MKKATSILLALATSVALLALPAAASAEYFIPEGNSAVNQYTEGVPSGGGEKSTKGAGEKPVKPSKAIGAKNTEKLEQAGGQEGREVAEVAAETAPPDIVAVEQEQAADKPSETGKDHQAGKGQGQQNDNGSTDTKGNEVVTPVASGNGPSGSGGLGEIVSAATGGSGGGIGLLLPLAIVAAVAWGVGYAWRKRDSDPAPNPQ